MLSFTFLLEISQGLQSFPRYTVVSWLCLAPAQLPWQWLGRKLWSSLLCFSPSLFHFPNKSSTARGSKTTQGNTCSSHPHSGPSSHKPEPLKSFSLLLGLFPHIIFFFTDTNKPSRNNFNWTQPKAGLLYLLLLLYYIYYHQQILIRWKAGWGGRVGGGVRVKLGRRWKKWAVCSIS